MDLEFYVRVRTCEKRVTGKQPLSSGESVLVTRANNDEDAVMKIISIPRINIKGQHSAFSGAISKTVSKSNIYKYIYIYLLKATFCLTRRHLQTKLMYRIQSNMQTFVVSKAIFNKIW